MWKYSTRLSALVLARRVNACIAERVGSSETYKLVPERRRWMLCDLLYFGSPAFFELVY